MWNFGKKRNTHDDDNTGVETNEEAIVEEVSGDGAEISENVQHADNADSDVMHGPWDIDDPDAPDIEEYVNIGSLYIPIVHYLKMQFKFDEQRQMITGVTLMYKDSALELEVFAAPRATSLWDEIRAEIIKNSTEIAVNHGEFGSELTLTVPVGNKESMQTRIIGIDGPRWMLRAIFTGNAARQGEEQEFLNDFVRNIIVDRGSEPFAPRDVLPLQPPTLNSNNADTKIGISGDDDGSDGPLNYMTQVQAEQVVQRGPLFSEMR